MPDQFKTVTTTGYGTRIGNSFKGIVAGLLMFVGSFGVLYWNEGRVDVSLIAQTAVEVKSDAVDSSADAKLISTTGAVTSDEQVGDDMFLKPGDFLAVKRTSEMYAWVEKTENKTTSNTGGSETTETTYTYVKEWVENPASSGSFKYPQDHQNPAKSIESATKNVSAAKVGVYDLDMSKIEFPAFDKLPLNADKVNLGAAPAVVTPPTVAVPSTTVSTTTPVLSGDYIYVGKGTMSAPQIGDVRVGYSVLNKGINATVFGKLNGSGIETYVDQKTNEKLYRMFDGSRDEAISTLHSEYTMMLWIFRAVGFLLMWMGLAALFAPISTLLDVLPIFGSLSKGIIGAATFVVSLVLSIVTIVVSMIVHSLVAVIIAVLVVIALVIFLMKRKGKKAAVVGA